MFPLVDEVGPNPVELFQLWLNLPASAKMAAPHFSMLWDRTIPRVAVTDAAGRPSEVTVIAGAIGDVRAPPPPPASWASRPEADLQIFTLRIAAGAELVLPAARAGSNRTLYVFAGDSISVDGERLRAGTAVDLVPERAVKLTAGAQEVEALVLGGRPIAEPIARQGPFVMNTRAEIEQAYHDYRSGAFGGGWRWPQTGPVHGREDRFARRPDGTVEKPA
jgi:redox-sensitive bicupin YhaK (pirin superfamily)